MGAAESYQMVHGCRRNRESVLSGYHGAPQSPRSPSQHSLPTSGAVSALMDYITDIHPLGCIAIH